MTQKQGTTGQLADVKNISREEEPPAEDRCEQVRVLSRVHRAEENHLALFANGSSHGGGRFLEPLHRRGGTIDAARVTLEVG